MSKASALAAATAVPATAPAATPPPTNPIVTPRQSTRTLVPKEGTPTVVAAPAPAVAAAPEPVSTEPKDPRFEHLAKKEAALQKEREALKKDREANAAERANFEDVRKKYQDFETMKAKDPIQAMKLAGFSDTDIFNYYAKATEDAKLKETPEGKALAVAQAEIAKFETKLAERDRVAKEAQDATTIRQFKGKISQTVASNPDKYEYCKFNGAAADALIYETVEKVFQDSGEVMTTTEAADLVEKYYEDQDKAMATLKKRGVTPATSAPQRTTTTTEKTLPPSRTLTNKVAATVASTAPKAETREEKKERLIQQIKDHGLRK